MFKFKRNCRVSELDQMSGFWGEGNFHLTAMLYDGLAHLSFNCKRMPNYSPPVKIPYRELKKKLCERCAHLKSVNLAKESVWGLFSTGELEEASLFVEYLLSDASSNVEVLSFFSLFSSANVGSRRSDISEDVWLKFNRHGLESSSKMAFIAQSLDFDSRLEKQFLNRVSSPRFFDDSVYDYAGMRKSFLPLSESGSSLLFCPLAPTGSWYSTFEVVKDSGVLVVPDSLTSLFDMGFLDAFKCESFPLPEGFTLDQVETVSVLYARGTSDLSVSAVWSAACALEN